jgi:hypothetical protein
MPYLNIITNEYSVTEAQVKQRYPQVSFTDIFAPPEGSEYVWYDEIPKPEFNPDIEKLEEDSPEWVIDKWVQKWRVISLNNEERAARLQAKREGMTTPIFNGKAALLIAGEMAAVQAILDDPDTPALYKLAFDSIPVWRRISPAILWMQQQMGWTDEFVDNLFEQANAIEI